MHRRAVLAALIAAFPLAAAAASAPWPDRAIKVVVPFAAGTPADTVARIAAKALQKALYQPVLVENRTGGEGTVGIAFAKKAVPDGYTLLLATSATLLSPAIQKDAGFDPVADFAPVSTLGGFPYAIFANPKVPVRSVQDLLAHARGSKLTYGSANAGEHFAASQFAQAANVQLAHVPYAASPLADLAAGRIDLYVGLLEQALAESRKGRARLLATMTVARTPLTPSVPALAEENIAVPAAGLAHVMLLAPARTPPDVVARLAREVQGAIGDKAVRAELENTSLIPRASSPGELAREIAEARKAWAQFGRESGLSK